MLSFFNSNIKFNCEVGMSENIPLLLQSSQILLIYQSYFLTALRQDILLPPILRLTLEIIAYLTVNLRALLRIGKARLS